jgi:hypothetical protein
MQQPTVRDTGNQKPELHLRKMSFRSRCTESKSCTKTVTRHVWQDYVELAEDIRHTPKYKELYKKRKETIERVFADAKVKYGMRYTLYRGLTQVTNWVKLKFAAMNLKKLAMWKWRDGHPSGFLLILLCYFPIAYYQAHPSFNRVGWVLRQSVLNNGQHAIKVFQHGRKAV